MLFFEGKAQSNETGQKVSTDVVLAGKINRSVFKSCFCNTEAFFYFPAFPVNPYDLTDRLFFKICTDSVKAIIHFLFGDPVRIKAGDLFIAYLTVLCNGILCDKAGRIRLPVSFAVIAFFDHCLSPLYLGLAYVS